MHDAINKIDAFFIVHRIQSNPPFQAHSPMLFAVFGKLSKPPHLLSARITQFCLLNGVVA
jgi:hypothetical protein